MQGFKSTMCWNKYRAEITTQPKNNNLDNLIDPTFGSINRLFVLSFESSNKDPIINSLDVYYMTTFEINDFNVLIDKPYCDQLIKNKKHMKN